MDYGRLQPSDPGGSSRHYEAEQPIALPQKGPSTSSSPNINRSRRNKLILISLLSVALILASAVSAVILLTGRSKASSQSSAALHRKPTQAISNACAKTQFPALCVDSLLDFPGSVHASEQDLVHISFNMTLQHLSKALYLSTSLSYLQMDPHSRSAYDDCLELLDSSIDALSRSLTTVVVPGSSSQSGSAQDVLTWLSAALTNQDTCGEGFSQATGSVKNEMNMKLKDLSELVSNCLAIYSAVGSNDFSGVPIQNKRRRLLHDMESDIMGDNADMSRDFPRWLNRREKKLLSVPIPQIQADIVVSKDGKGTYKTIAEAIKKAPEYSSRRFIIYVRAGR